MNHVYRDPQQLAEMYYLSRSGVDTDGISEKLELPYGSVVTALRTINRYLNGKAKTQKRQSPKYKEAVKLIRKHQREENTTTPAPSHFDTLKESFTTFQHSIAAFIEADTANRLAPLRAQNKALLEENERLQREIESLRNTNWIDALQGTITKEEIL